VNYSAKNQRVIRDLIARSPVIKSFPEDATLHPGIFCSQGQENQHVNSVEDVFRTLLFFC
jgi:hypothetical protein